MPAFRLGALPAFIVLYGLMYAAFGVASPYWPRILELKGLDAAQLGLLLGLGTLVRLAAGPLVGRAADMLGALRAALALCAAAAAVAALALSAATGFAALLAVYLLQSATLAPTTTLADALALSAAIRRPGGFEYGVVRGAASAAFIAGTLAVGQLVAGTDLSIVIWMNAGLLGAAAVATMLVPGLDVARTAPDRRGREKSSVLGGVRDLLGQPLFRRLILVAALVSGSHAMHDAFAVIRWTAAGLGPAAISLLWSAAVAAEVVVFLFVGPRLVDRLGSNGAAAVAAVAGIVRWVAMSQTTSVAVLALVQPLHGLTFALLHLGCMRLIVAVVTPRLAATAQSLYALGLGGASALTTLLAGPLFGRFGASAFLVMALMCALALRPALGLRLAEPESHGRRTRSV